jgi:hypothetical protein
MKQVVSENPALNSPFIESARHFKFTNDGITDETVKQTVSFDTTIPLIRLGRCRHMETLRENHQENNQCAMLIT